MTSREHIRFAALTGTPSGQVQAMQGGFKYQSGMASPMAPSPPLDDAAVHDEAVTCGHASA